MKSRRFGGRLLKALALGSVLALAALGTILAQDGKPRVVVRAPGEEVEIKEGGQDFQVDIVVENVKNLAAFQFALAYDSSIIRYVSVKEGDFLGSSGREPKCLDPRVETGNPEVLRFNCVTMGPPVSVGGKAGPDGSGVLATVTFSPIGGGTTPLDLKEGRLVAAEINEKGAPVELETTTQGASLDVASKGGGFSWLLWGPIIGVVAIVVVGLTTTVLMRRTARTVTVAESAERADDTEKPTE